MLLEDLGCVADRIENAHANSMGLQKAIDYAIEKGWSFVSSALYKEGLLMKVSIDIGFNMGTLIAVDSVNVLMIDDGTNSLKIYQKSKARRWIYCKETVKF